MAKRGKRKLTKKAASVLRTDVLVSVAAVSLLFNIFFVAGLLMFTNSNALDDNFYDIAYSNYCDDNYTENLVEYMEESTDPQRTKLTFEAFCKRENFLPYYQNALEAYISDNLIQ